MLPFVCFAAALCLCMLTECMWVRVYNSTSCKPCCPWVSGPQSQTLQSVITRDPFGSNSVMLQLLLVPAGCRQPACITLQQQQQQQQQITSSVWRHVSIINECAHMQCLPVNNVVGALWQGRVDCMQAAHPTFEHHPTL
jgi:hypothetical protein